MQNITPFLWFDKQAEQAAKLYVSVFKNSKIIDVNRDGKKVHSVLFRINGQTITAFNGGPYFKFTPAISFFVECKTQKEIDYFWNKLSKGGKKGQCGWLQDKFGLSWQIVPAILPKLLGGKDEDGASRAFNAMLQMKKLDIKKLNLAYDGE